MTLKDALPARPGPWLARSISKWGLIAPYDPTVTEQQWEQYYKERAALEWLSNAVAAGWMECLEEPRGAERASKKAKKDGGKDKENKAPNSSLVWSEEWDLPIKNMWVNKSNDTFDWCEEEIRARNKLVRDQIASTLKGCKQLPDVDNLAKKVAKGSFDLSIESLFDDCDSVRSATLVRRLYAPTATARSVDCKYFFHDRMRYYSYESFGSLYYHMRSASHCRADKPQEYSVHQNSTNALFTRSLEESGTDRAYMDRQVLSKSALADLGAWWFGDRGVISARKVMTLMARAAGVHTYAKFRADHEDWLFRVARRRSKLQDGETSDAKSEDDSDSGEDEKKEKILSGRYEDHWDIGW